MDVVLKMSMVVVRFADMLKGKFKFKPHDLKPMQTGLFWLWITVLFFVVDQWTKSLAVSYFSGIERYSVVEVMPHFNLLLRYNTGAAFSFLADQSGWQVYFFTIVSTVVSLAILYWMYTLSAKNRWLSIALAFILAGAFGNLYDRVTLGKVVDFIDWYYQDYRWPAFNVADAVIMLGAAMMLWDSFMNPQDDKETDSKKES